MNNLNELRDDVIRLVLNEAIYSGEWRHLLRSINIKYNLANGGIPEDYNKVLSFYDYLTKRLE